MKLQAIRTLPPLGTEMILQGDKDAPGLGPLE